MTLQKRVEEKGAKGSHDLDGGTGYKAKTCQDVFGNLL